MNLKDKLFQHNITSESVRLGVILAVIGGFLDAYTYILEGGVFANAQTGNLVIFGINLSQGHFYKALYSFLPILAFIIGVFVSVIVKNKINIIFDWEIVVILIEAFVLLLIAIIPFNLPRLIVTTSISFVSSMQIQTFRKLVNSPYSTTMCTGNLRSGTEALYLAIFKKDKEALEKTKRYYTIILFFLVGSALGAYLSLQLGRIALLVPMFLLLLCTLLFKIDKKVFVKEYNRQDDYGAVDFDRA